MVSNFSAGYVLLESIEIQRWPKEEAVMPCDLYDKLTYMIGEPIIAMIDGVHYQFKPKPDLPSMSAIVPEVNHGKEPGGFLLQKP